MLRDVSVNRFVSNDKKTGVKKGSDKHAEHCYNQGSMVWLLSSFRPLRQNGLPPQQGVIYMGQGFKVYSSSELYCKWPKVAETMTEARQVLSKSF